MVYDLFSYRNRDITKDSDSYIYEIPTGFRNQILHITDGILALLMKYYSPLFRDIPDACECICRGFSREKELISIHFKNEVNSWPALAHYILSCKDIDLLDLIDYIFGYILSDKISIYHTFGCQEFTRLDNAIIELNERFKHHNLGYEIINGRLIKKTNKLTHEAIVRPALNLLCDEDFRGAEDEYMNALKFFRYGENKEAILNAAKAFESFMKILCTKMGYSFEKDKITASGLLHLLKSNNFYPEYLSDHLENLNKVLLNGAPTVRNKTAGHGQGEECRTVPDDYATYVMNLVASNIVFLHSIYKEHHSGK